jgi:hypothetical protein
MKNMKQASLDTVLLEFRVEAGTPKASILDVYCRRYPQFARELTDYAIAWVIDSATRNEAPVEVIGDVDTSSRLVSRTISRLYEKMREREDEAKGTSPLQVQQTSDPFERLSVARVREIRDELGIDTPMFTIFRNRLIAPATVPRSFLERFADLLASGIKELVHYLELPAVVHIDADFKAKGKPSVGDSKMSFQEAVSRSSLDEERKQALLKG